MAFRTLLIAVGTAGSDQEIERAIVIAETLGAHLNVLVLGIAPPPPSSPYGIVSNDLWAGEIREGQETAQARADAIRKRLATSAVSASVEAQYVDRGTIATLAARSARYADVTLISPREEEGDPLQGWVLNGALFESGRPVVLLPPGETVFPKPGRVMIAWDASVEASKAVREAIGLMKTAEAVDAVLIDPVPSFEGHGPEPGADLATYLGRHGIGVTVHRLPKEGREVADIIARSAVDLGADMVVMGGFGHSRLRQRIFGGTTTTMIKDPPVAVLMAH
jgi:nucleotide-binding universal stress UspA family protein